MEQNEIDKLNNETSLSNRFIVKIDGINEKWIESCSLPLFDYAQTKSLQKAADILAVSLESRYSNTKIYVTAYYNAAPSLIEWISNRETKRSAKITILKNNEEEFITFYLPICSIDAIDFGLGKYKSNEPLHINFTLNCDDVRFDVK